MRIKAESRIITFGDLKAAVKAFEEQGFRDSDLVNPPSDLLPPESPETNDVLGKSLGALFRNMSQQEMRKKAGLVLWMRRNVTNTNLPGE